ncbi:endonuclease/exonuclease/phosphatase family protein [Pseudomonadota bacterium]
MKARFLLLPLIFVISSESFAKDISIMSWNVYFDDATGYQRYPEIIRTISEQKPDVVCLQEVTNKFIGQLTSSSNLAGYLFTNSHGDGAYKNIILSKPRISSSGIINLPTKMNRYAPYIETEINGKSTVVINLHLDSMMDDTELRISQLEKVVEFTNNAHSFVLCGDLNFGDGDKENEFVSTHFKDIGAKNKQVTYDVENNVLAEKTKFLLEKSRRLDHILISDDIQASNYRVLITPYSDHYPITADLTP